MNEVALIGMESRVLADVLSALLHRNIAVNAIVTQPERMMINNVDLTVSHLKPGNPDMLADNLEGYHDAVIAFSDDLTDEAADNFALHHFGEMLTAVKSAGVSRLAVVGSPQSKAFFLGALERTEGFDWVFISTEGNFAERAVDEVLQPRHHSEEFVM